MRTIEINPSANPWLPTNWYNINEYPNCVDQTFLFALGITVRISNFWYEHLIMQHVFVNFGFIQRLKHRSVCRNETFCSFGYIPRNKVYVLIALDTHLSAVFSLACGLPLKTLGGKVRVDSAHRGGSLKEAWAIHQRCQCSQVPPFCFRQQTLRMRKDLWHTTRLTHPQTSF